MTLQDVYDQLSFGELRQLFLGEGDNTTDTMMPADFKKVLPSVKLGITALHTRFQLRTGTTSVTLVPLQQTYILPLTDLLKVERVYGVYDSEEFEIPVNMHTDPASIMTPTMKSLLLPSDTEKAPWLLETTELRVVYRQDHPVIDAYLANASPLSVDLDLPIMYLEPLLMYVASRLHNPIGMTPGAMHEGNNYMLKYEAACALLENYGFQINEDQTNCRAEVNGWVV